ncbi:uncharacterized protein LOC123536439 [Mercenaria mercenaria]|uniref:uncharacterized protein LOC123536439 n=1 Tax=Mercenaria mercenaria TaxID=6596 RepID=UPI00234F47B6|nr:uncharacterized protein LOC123536439 [Mercenaria mercenaria]
MRHLYCAYQLPPNSYHHARRQGDRSRLTSRRDCLVDAIYLCFQRLHAIACMWKIQTKIQGRAEGAVSPSRLLIEAFLHETLTSIPNKWSGIETPIRCIFLLRLSNANVKGIKPLNHLCRE